MSPCPSTPPTSRPSGPGSRLLKRPGHGQLHLGPAAAAGRGAALAAEYGARLIALTMGQSGIPMTAEERVALAIDMLIPRALEVGIPMENLYLDPLLHDRVGLPGVLPARDRSGALHQAGHGPGAHDHRAG